MLNIVRLGHYFTPMDTVDGQPIGSCQTALVCDVFDDDGEEKANLAVFTSSADLLSRLNVRVSAIPVREHATFHLSGDCPWHR